MTFKSRPYPSRSRPLDGDSPANTYSQLSYRTRLNQVPRLLRQALQLLTVEKFSDFTFYPPPSPGAITGQQTCTCCKTSFFGQISNHSDDSASPNNLDEPKKISFSYNLSAWYSYLRYANYKHRDILIIRVFPANFKTCSFSPPHFS